MGAQRVQRTGPTRSGRRLPPGLGPPNGGGAALVRAPRCRRGTAFAVRFAAGAVRAGHEGPSSDAHGPACAPTRSSTDVRHGRPPPRWCRHYAARRATAPAGTPRSPAPLSVERPSVFAPQRAAPATLQTAPDCRQRAGRQAVRAGYGSWHGASGAQAGQPAPRRAGHFGALWPVAPVGTAPLPAEVQGRASRILNPFPLGGVTAVLPGRPPRGPVAATRRPVHGRRACIAARGRAR